LAHHHAGRHGARRASARRHRRLCPGLVPAVDAHVLPINNFIATTAPLGAERAAALVAGEYAVSDSRFVVYYFRTPDHRLLFGGGERYSYALPGNIAAFVRPTCCGSSATGRCADRPCLGRHAVDHPAPPAPCRAGRARAVVAQRLSGLGVVLAPRLGGEIGAAMAGLPSPRSIWRAACPRPAFPEALARWPTMAAAMTFYALRDRF
jgi:gamma-glutamylputrescine oxidase